ncbi:hypothetical protein [Microbacterium testaceum]|uniref:hypothetical protein n=1 Tax=Microbacterium testaceum TaxID=2033 RepID=UPI002434A107|nr:hypothetical protein [Microbacterium testaceum]
MSNVIRLDGDLANYNAQLVTSVADDIPSQSDICQVDGPSQGSAAESFVAHVRTRAQELAAEVASVQEYVRKNAQALATAVATLRERDELSAAVADQTASLIEAASTLATDTPSNGGAAGVRSALGAPQ